MNLPDDLLPPLPPMLPLWRDVDVEKWLAVKINLSWMLLYVWDFASAVILVEEARAMGEKSNVAPRWINIAARDAAANLYHYAVAIESLRQMCSANPPIERGPDMIKVRELGRELLTRFPHARDVRHPAVHLADFISSPAKVRQHGRPGDGNSMNWSPGTLGDDNIFRMTYRKSNAPQTTDVSYDLTRDAARFLVDHLRRFYALFDWLALKHPHAGS